MPPTISVVIPAYNVQFYIEQCVQSVLAQLGEQHELVVVNDGSTDATLAVLTRLQEAWPHANFHVHTQANQGIAATRNACIAAARGDYIAFLDSDDVLRAGSLHSLGDAIGAHRPDLIAFDFRMWHPNEPAKTHEIALHYPAGVLRDPQALLTAFLANRHMYVWAHVIRRDIYAQLPMPIFPPGRVFEDVATLPRLVSQCASLLHVPHLIVDYRQHPTSITQSISEAWCMDFVAALPVARLHLQRRGANAAVQRQFDMMIAHFYMSLVKSSYQLPHAVGQRTRARIKASFLENMFGDYAGLVAAAGAGQLQTKDRVQDQRMLAELKKVLSGDLLFHFRQAASRKYKMWRQGRKLRRHLVTQRGAQNKT
ncbi:glycosyltransferase family 2 protein [Massilia sp. TSP1-1-2]|uniref:glycosyltransferase family 2 protein n=1 Tax=Massilia sp. TSP1-1-2 TaxID=2804649 RepID=UPI003CF9DFB0